MFPSPQYHPSTPQDDSWPRYDEPPPGYVPVYGPSPWEPAYPPPSYRPNTAPAYAAAALFGACGLLSLILAVVSWHGTGNPHLMAAVIGVVFSERLTGNIDFGISATMTVACTTLTFAGVLTARLGFVRWILFSVGVIVSVYYFIALAYLLANGLARFVSAVLISLFLWSAATVVAALPATARAMRGRASGPPPAPAHPWYHG